MKLGEALTKRSQLQKRFGELRERIAGSAFAQEGEAPPEDANALLPNLKRSALSLNGSSRASTRRT